MPTRKEILKYLKLTVSVETEPDKDVQEHIGNMILGTPGKVRYRHTSFSEKLPFLGKIYFLNLKKSDRLLGTIAFSLRDSLSVNRAHRSWYVRYFSIRAPLRDTNFRSVNKHKRDSSGRDNLLKSAAGPFFADPDQIAGGEKFDSDRSLVYAYIEKENFRSWNFSESVGFETAGKIHTSLYSRFRPKMDPRVRAIDPADKDWVRNRLREFYRDYNLFTIQNLFFNDNYMVWKENGRVVAGCQANPELWQIVNIPGFISNFFLRGLARLPFLSRRYNPEFMKFVAFEGIWYEEEYEACLLPLIESALAYHKLYLGILWLDSSSHVLKLINKLGKRGLVGRFFNTMPGDIRVRFINWKEEDKQEFFKNPSYISCFDMT